MRLSKANDNWTVAPNLRVWIESWSEFFFWKWLVWNLHSYDLYDLYDYIKETNVILKSLHTLMKFYFDWRKLTRTFTHLINSWNEREIGETNFKSHAWSKRWSSGCILMVFFPQKVVIPKDHGIQTEVDIWFTVNVKIHTILYGVSTVRSIFWNHQPKTGISMAKVPKKCLASSKRWWKNDVNHADWTFGWCLQIEGLISTRLVGEDLVEIL